MTAFFLALLAGLLGAAGGRDQRVVADLRSRLGPARPLLATGLAACIVSASAAAALGSGLAHEFSPDSARMFAAFALGFAAFELARPVSHRPASEPTRSMGAVFIVLLAAQVGDAARFLLLALAALVPGAGWVALGGAVGGMAATSMAWAEPGLLAGGKALTVLRRVLAVLAALAAVWLGLRARGLVG